MRDKGKRSMPIPSSPDRSQYVVLTRAHLAGMLDGNSVQGTR